MNKETLRARIGEIQGVNSTIESALNLLWCLSSERALVSTDYRAEELKKIDEALEATVELMTLLKALKRDL